MKKRVDMHVRKKVFTRVGARREKRLREWRYGKPDAERTGCVRPFTEEQIRAVSEARTRARDPSPRKRHF
jgi:hypothetical protein